MAERPLDDGSDHEPFLFDMPDQDEDPGCPVCYRVTDECPGHEGDPELLDVVSALVHALRVLPRLYPVPKSIIIEINRCEDWLRTHHPDHLPGGRF